MSKKYKIIQKRLRLSKGEVQEYYIDENPKVQIAETRAKDKKIYVNKRFENLPEKEKVAILYHERGHSNFLLWKCFKEVSSWFFSFGLIFFGMSIILLLVNLTTKYLIFDIPNLIWIVGIIIGLFLFVGFISITYLLENIADIYSISKTNNKTLIEVIKKEYANRNKSGWSKYILHPSPKLRDKIAESILKWN
jgi:hypothetical protein